MFGTIATMRVKPGCEDDLLNVFEEWGRDRGARIDGPIRVYISRSERDANVLLNIALFDTREHYEANAADPAQDAWYRKMLPSLAGEPACHDHAVALAHAPV